MSRKPAGFARRTVLKCFASLAGGNAVALAGQRSPASVRRGGPRRYGAVAFDAFVLFNPDSIVSSVERVVSGKGRDLINIWRTRQFEYCWLRTIAGRYADFFRITEDALDYAASAVQTTLTASQKQQLLDAYLHLAPWPDTAAALRRLRDSHIQLLTITNFSPAMLRANVEHAGLAPLFDALISTDANHTYKPHRRAYQLGVDRIRLPKEDIVFAAFAGWDAAGAQSFGYPTVWVNRFNQPPEQLGISPERTVAGLDGLLEFVLNAPGSYRPR